MLRITVLLISVSAMLPLMGAETDKVKNLTPRAESPTAMRACGVEIEQVKEQKKFNRRYVFTGDELLTKMSFCSKGAKKNVDQVNQYKVPEGTVGWVDDDGEAGILEECDNEFIFVTAVPREPEQPITVNVPHPVLPDLPNIGVPPWTPVVPQESAPPVNRPDEKCECVAIMSSYAFSELRPDSKPIEVWAAIAGGELKDGGWYLDGQLLANGLHVTLDAKMLYNRVHGKSGSHLLYFRGIDAHDNIVGCGAGVTLTLIKKGRSWFWKLPIVHCVYTFTHDFKKWKGGPLVEKAVCGGEAALAWWLWPVAALSKPAGIAGALSGGFILP
jgi:hypothetical protein